MRKKGIYHVTLLHLIIAVLILGFSLFFIFNEFFRGELGDREVCAQSIQVRALVPNYKISGIDAVDFKSEFPLKCKTRVVEISESDVKDVKSAEKKIMDTMVDCWALYGSGDYDVFPSKFFKSSVCIPCARVHLTNDAKKYMEKENININIANSFDSRMTPEFSYYSYLENSGDRFSAFNFGNAVRFDLNGEAFEIKGIEWVNDYIPSLWENVELRNRLGGSFVAEMASVDISLPAVFEFDKEDLIINYGVVTVGKKEFGNYIPYLFYFQAGQSPQPFNEVNKKFVADPLHTAAVAAKYLGVAFVPGAIGIKSAILLLSGISFEDDLLSDISDSAVSFCGEWGGIPG